MVETRETDRATDTDTETQTQTETETEKEKRKRKSLKPKDKTTHSFVLEPYKTYIYISSKLSKEIYTTYHILTHA